MSMRGLKQIADYFEQSLPPDGQLLASFVAGRDEAAFRALVCRHGQMVLGVCQRVLHQTQDAEDAFQATFLVLARKAGSVIKHASVSSWLYRVAFRTALDARAARLKRRRREIQMDPIPHPAVMPPEDRDWLPLLDRELDGLAEKYREAVVLCDLQGLSRKEAARVLGLAEGTLSSRLARARRMLAGKLARHGLSISGGALATALSAQAKAAVPASLTVATVRAAVLVAGGQWAGVSITAAVLMQGVIKAMFLKKLKIVVAFVLVMATLGASGLTYRAAEPSAPAANKPPSELEALRKENELLRLNLLVVLEKVRAQEAELVDVKGRTEALRAAQALRDAQDDIRIAKRVRVERKNLVEKLFESAKLQDPVKEAEAALTALKKASDPESQRRAMAELEEALRKLRGQDRVNPPAQKGNEPGKPQPQSGRPGQ
jgi:RNA polymerase sigma factor (sigma-70 family)